MSLDSLASCSTANVGVASLFPDGLVYLTLAFIEGSGEELEEYCWEASSWTVVKFLSDCSEVLKFFTWIMRAAGNPRVLEDSGLFSPSRSYCGKAFPPSVA